MTRLLVLAAVLVLALCPGAPALAGDRLGSATLPVDAERAWRQATSLVAQGLPAMAMEPMARAAALAPGDIQIQCDYQDLMRSQGLAADMVGEYRKRKERRPEDPDALYLYGRATGDPAIAREVFERAIELAPGHVWATQGLGGVAAVEGRLDDALDWYRKALFLDPTRADVHNKVAGIHYARGEVDAAVAAWKEAQRLAPDDYHAFLNMGAVLSMQGDLEGAAALLREAVARAPGNPLAYVNLGYVLFKLHLYDDALANFAAALAINPRDRKVEGSRDLVRQVRDGRIPFAAFAPYEKALAASMVDPQKAIQHFREVLLLAPGFAVAHTSLGVLLIGTGEVDEGLASLRKAVDLAPDDVTARFNLGFVLMGRQELEEASLHLDAAARLDPGDVDILSAQALACLGLGKPDRSVGIYRKALDLRPRDPVLWLQLSSAEAASDDLATAVESARAAIRIAPSFAAARDQLVMLLAEDRRFDDALAELRELERLAPGHPDLAARRAAIEGARNGQQRAASVPGQVRLSRIYLHDRAKVDVVLGRIAAGEDFASLARSYGEGAERTRGGDIGFLDPKDLVPDLAGAVQGLPPGGTSAAVGVGSGWVILHRTQ